ncbi:MAG: aspartate/glutamate racemase family protein [Dehalococcoidales bacterium]|nr:aspartate/glutamate racemase family protein [Dehalococcoidales bacterium]
MKIWVQSGSGLTKDAKSVKYGKKYEESLNKHFQEVARPGTKVDVYGIGSTPVGKDRYYSSQHIVASLMIKSVLQAKPQGYDAVAIVNTLDHGYYEIHEIVDLPLVFITEASLYVACMLAPRFAFLTHNESLLLRMTELARRYGMTDRMAPGANLNLVYEDFPKMYADPKTYIERFTEEGRKVIRQGANVLLLAGNPFNMFMVDQGVKEIDGVPVLDVCGAVIKVAELLVDLEKMGARRSKRGLFAIPKPNEIEQIQKLYLESV